MDGMSGRVGRMSLLNKAMRTAENFLEHVDESVSKASKRLTIDGSVLTGGEDEHDGEEGVERRREGEGGRVGLKGIVHAEEREDGEGGLVERMKAEREELRRELGLVETELKGLKEVMKEGRRGVREVEEVEEELRQVREENETMHGEVEDVERRWRTAEEAREDLEVKMQVLKGELESVKQSFKFAAERGDEDVDGARREAVEAVLAHEREVRERRGGGVFC